MPSTPVAPLPRQLDSRVLGILALLQSVALLIAGLIASVAFIVRIVSPFGERLASGWDALPLSSAVCSLLLILALLLSLPLRSARSHQVSRLLALLTALLAGSCLLQGLSGLSPSASILLSHLNAGGVMFRHDAIAFLLLGINVLYIGSKKRTMSRIVDLVTVAVCLLTFTLFTSSVFSSMRLFGPELPSRLSLQCILVLVCLSLAVFNRRAEHGAFSILLSPGIGGKTARLAAPFAFAIPFMVATVRALVVNCNLMTPAYAAAMATSTVSVLTFCLIVALSRRTDNLERHVRELSLRDELTRLYNRRGFYLLAEQALRLSRRSGEPFSLLFLDMDNLKHTNDTEGHEAGSELLREMAALLQQNFRETDLISRLGGDEFVVAGKATTGEMAVAAYRLQQLAAAANAAPDRRYMLSFSLGHVTCDALRPQNLDEMIERADQIMYKTKRSKKAGHGLAGVPALVPRSEPPSVANVAHPILVQTEQPAIG